MKLFQLALGIFCVSIPVSAKPPSLAKQLHAALNEMRENPSSLIPYLTDMKKRFEGKKIRLSPTLLLATQEGVAAVDEAIAVLKSTKPLSQLKPSAPLTRAAQDHANAQAKTGGTGHDGKDGSTPHSRLLKYGTPLGKSGECIGYGAFGDNQGKDMLAALVVDDGVASRGHRKILLDPDYRLTGIACGPHPVHSPMCVITVAAGITPK